MKKKQPNKSSVYNSLPVPICGHLDFIVACLFADILRGCLIPLIDFISSFIFFSMEKHKEIKEKLAKEIENKVRRRRLNPDLFCIPGTIKHANQLPLGTSSSPFVLFIVYSIGFIASH